MATVRLPRKARGLLAVAFSGKMWYHELLQKASPDPGGVLSKDVLRAIQERRQHNHRLPDAFFRAELSTEDRWKLIEQYFLGNESYVAQVLNLSE